MNRDSPNTAYAITTEYVAPSIPESEIMTGDTSRLTANAMNAIATEYLLFPLITNSVVLQTPTVYTVIPMINVLKYFV